MHMNDKDKIPFFGTWNRWYFFVISVLVLMIIFFVWFTKYFA